MIDHHKDLTKQLRKIGHPSLPYILILHSTDRYFEEMSDLLEPFGHLGSIVGANKDVDLTKLKINLAVLIGNICLLKPIMTTTSLHKEQF